jgi:DNA-binding PadR family transcriptional regulator
MSNSLWSRFVKTTDDESSNYNDMQEISRSLSQAGIAVESEPDDEHDLSEDLLADAEQEAAEADASGKRSSDSDEKLDDLLKRINHLAQNPAGSEEEPVDDREQAAQSEGFSLESLLGSDGEGDFIPLEPRTWDQVGLTENEVESLVLKFLLARGESTGRGVSDQIKLPFVLLDELLRKMKNDQLVYYRATSEANDYVYSLTDLGRERARRYTEHCTYFGSAPVNMPDYIASVKAQSIEHQRPSAADLERAFQDLLINKQMLTRLGPAVNSGRGMFLFGSPGNGKTSIAERVTKSFGPTIWIPRALNVDGDIIRLFDPMNHEEIPLARRHGLLDGSEIDKRWVRIKRPTIVVGGELKMSNLEVTFTPNTGICESPIQLKSNCGVLVIDDFGRQSMTTDELLNRWIVPLEKRYDFLNMPSGKKIQVPFDQLVIFSTNLEPRDLVDDAFLRRIPYKIEVSDPSEAEFRELFTIMCPLMGFEYNHDPIDYLIETHYKAVKRPFRCCQPRDLLLQVKNFCAFNSLPLELKRELFDYATENYFAVM